MWTRFFTCYKGALPGKDMPVWPILPVLLSHMRESDIYGVMFKMFVGESNMVLLIGSMKVDMFFSLSRIS